MLSWKKLYKIYNVLSRDNYLIFFLHAAVSMADVSSKNKAWEALSNGDFAQAKQYATQCMKNISESGYKLQKTDMLNSQEAFKNYNKYLVEAEFVECYYLLGLSYEHMRDCKSNDVYKTIIKLYPTIWTGWPGTPWQPAQAAKEGLARWKCTFKEGQ